MTLKEVLFFRLPQFIQLYFLGKIQAKSKIAILSFNESFEAPSYSIDKLGLLLKKDLDIANYFFFNTSVNILKPINWRKDYHNNVESSIAYYNSINKQDFNKNGDVKFVAELSRLHFLPFIAFKYVESNDKFFLRRIQEVLKNWDTQNPYLYSINWTSGIEVAIRSVNIIYTHTILKSFNFLSEDLDLEIRKHISKSYLFLKNHLSLYSSANNHLMAELMGLNVISSYLKVCSNEQLKWESLFYSEIKKQINSDGVHMELCTRYHSEVLDQITIGLHFLMSNKRSIPGEIRTIHKKMFNFVEHVNYEGVDTIFGDNDEGFVINAYFEKEISLYTSQLSTGNFLFQTNYKALPQIDFRNYLLFGDLYSVIEGRETPESTFFEDSGYCFMYDHISKIKLSFDVGEIGDKLSAAHGHSDICHFVMQQGEDQILIDPGTYQYHQKESFWRNYFRGISAHNTISINKQNHAVINNRMSWIERPEKPETIMNISDSLVSCESIHNSFLKEDVIHSRILTLDKKNKKIILMDILKSENSIDKKVNFYLHFSPGLKINKQENNITINSENNKVILENKNFKDSVLKSGDLMSPFGWYSSSYNSKEESVSLNLSLTMEDNLFLETVFYYE